MYNMQTLETCQDRSEHSISSLFLGYFVAFSWHHVRGSCASNKMHTNIVQLIDGCSKARPEPGPGEHVICWHVASPTHMVQGAPGDLPTLENHKGQPWAVKAHHQLLVFLFVTLRHIFVVSSPIWLKGRYSGGLPNTIILEQQEFKLSDRNAL